MLKSNQTPSMKQIEEHLVGNICRCTGYRPILDAMKTFSNNVRDIEDLDDWVKICPMTTRTDTRKCKLIQQGDRTWFCPRSLESLFNYISNLPEDTEYKLVAGNTARGIYEYITEGDTNIDITKIPELKLVTSSPLEIGGCITITDAMNHFKTMMENDAENYQYLKVINDYLIFVASPALRDVATIAGNLMIKYQYSDFPSDLFTMLETVGAQVNIVFMENGKMKKVSMLPSQFLTIDMSKKVIKSFTFPKIPKTHVFKYFKVSPRNAFSYALVNAGFLAEFDENQKTIVKKPSFVFGGLSGKLAHADEVETDCVGKDLTDPKVFQKIIDNMNKVAQKNTDESHTAGKTYRANLATALLYKFLISSLDQSGAVSNNKVRKIFL